MWLVQTILFDFWFDDLAKAFQCYETNTRMHTYPRLEIPPPEAGVFDRLFR